jgi:hypothetical protein
MGNIKPILLDIDPITGQYIQEVWKDIPGYNGVYFVSNYGRVKTVKEKARRQCINKKGYLRVGLCVNYQLKTFLVHRLVMAVFDQESTNQVDHINTIKTDNRFLNLRYCTNRQNSHWARTARKHASNFLGVARDESANTPKKWKAQIKTNGRNKHIGRFHTEQEAHGAYLEALKNISA